MGSRLYVTYVRETKNVLGDYFGAKRRDARVRPPKRPLVRRARILSFGWQNMCKGAHTRLQTFFLLQSTRHGGVFFSPLFFAGEKVLPFAGCSSLFVSVCM